MSYIHLTIAEREEVRVMLEEGRSQRYISKQLQRSPSTISRELKRNKISLQPYKAHCAQERYQVVRQACRPVKKIMQSELQSQIIQAIEQYWSPEQAIGRLKLSISVPTIYRALRDGLLPKILIPKLRRQGRKSNGKNELRGKLSATTSIELRPAIVEKRERLGDWEGDTVAGTRGTGHFLTLVDRATSFLVACKMEDRQAETVLAAMTVSLQALPCHTITLDNGKEFARFTEIEEALKTKTYFAHPHSPWERPINEHTNGLLRQFFPKNSSFQDVSDADVLQAVWFLNHRPRKRLDWKTPFELFSDGCCA
jgi:IS30 family transposase